MEKRKISRNTRKRQELFTPEKKAVKKHSLMISRVIARISQQREFKKPSHCYIHGSFYMVYKAGTGHK